MEEIPMPQSSNSADPRVIAYKKLRKAVGTLGTALPFVLALGGYILFSTGIQSSLSAYYHTDIGSVFVGTLCAIGVFFYAYRGYTKDLDNDNAKTNFAGIFAIGVALFPTDPSGGVGIPETLTGKAHLAFAASFFAMLAYFCLCLFTKSRSKPHERPVQKQHRDRLYRRAGYTIIVSIVLIGVLGGIKKLGFVPEAVIQAVEAWNPVFVLESIAVIAFGVAWLAKGQAILGDTPEDQAEEEKSFLQEETDGAAA